MGAAFLAGFFFTFPAYLIDPWANDLGMALLENPALKNLWTSLYHMPIIPFTQFNNSLVLGSGVIGFILFIPVYIIATLLIKKYRTQIVEKFKTTKLWKFVKTTSFYKWYAKYDQLY